MDKTILITGAGSGIGRITAQTFLNAGWRVGLIGRRTDALRETAGDSGALVLPCDVCDADAVDAAFDRAAHGCHCQPRLVINREVQRRALVCRGLSLFESHRCPLVLDGKMAGLSKQVVNAGGNLPARLMR